MRKQAAPALAIVLAAGAAACGTSTDAGREPILDAPAAYHKRTCYRCHGRDREGTEIGPPLHGLAEHWDVDRLAAYIADPESFRKDDPRLEQLVDDYRGKVMKGYKLAESERKALATWLLADAADSSGAR